MSGLLRALRRTRSLETDGADSELARVLGMLDLTALGVGSTLGLGVYVLAGSVAKTVAGPAVCISFLVAAIASAFAGLCYAEFAARVPRAGSAYVYSYVSVGEFIAFTIGWNLILEYVIGTASVAKGMANYIDALANNTMRDTFIRIMPVNVPHLADYPDFFALALVLLISGLLCIGVKESSRLNNVFTMLNLMTVLIVIVTGSIYSDPNNWNIQVEDIPEDLRPQAGVGGFMPFGIAGIMAGAAKCFFGFVGFDCVATAGEEAKRPQRNIPLSIVFSLIIIFSAYFSISTVLTMMWPYYLQDADAPFPYVFTEVGLPAIKWIVTVGAIFALCTSLLGAIFPLPRVLYAMAGDGVIFRWLGIISSKTQTPVLATIISGIFAGVMAMIFNLNQLIDMMSIGTLLAYTIVAISVLVLRYDDDSSDFTTKNDDILKERPLDLFSVLKMTFNLNGLKKPTSLSANIAKAVILAYFIITIITCILLQWGSSVTNTIVMSVLGAVLLLFLFILCRLPTQDVSKISFTVPLVPLIPYLSVFMNLYLMVQLDIETWIRFIIWLVVGYSIYFFYGIRHSNLGKEAKTRKSVSEASTASVVTDKSIPITNEVTKC